MVVEVWVDFEYVVHFTSSLISISQKLVWNRDKDITLAFELHVPPQTKFIMYCIEQLSVTFPKQNLIKVRKRGPGDIFEKFDQILACRYAGDCIAKIFVFVCMVYKYLFFS